MRVLPPRLALCAALALASAAGCQQQSGPPKPTQKQLATRQWNAARSGVLANLAKEQYDTGSLDQARTSVDQALKLNPDVAVLHVLSAKIAIEQSNLDLAQRELKRAGELDPKDAEADYLGGVLYQRWQKQEQALDCYARAADKNPAELAYLMAKAETLVALDRSPEALAVLQEKIVYFEHSATIRDAAGQLLVQAGKLPQSLEMFRQATILANDDWTVREHLALAEYRVGQWVDCADLLGRLVKEPRYAKRADLFTALGECQLQLGKAREAREALTTAAGLDPASASIALSLTKAALELHDLKRAELSLKKAMALDPAGGESQLLLGYLRLRQGKLDEALAAFEKCAAADGGDAAARATGLCMSGYVLEKLGRGGEAIDCYARALKLQPDDELAHQLMSSVELHE